MTRGITRWQAAAGVSALVVVVVGSAGVAAAHLGHKSDAPANAITPPTAEVTVDPSMGETFTPETFPVGAGYLSASQAWAKWSNGKQLPDSLPATFGKLRMLTGSPGAPGVEMSIDGALVWAFEGSYCIARISGPAASPSPQSSPQQPPSCTTWTFLDAKTGSQLMTQSVPNS